MYKEPIARMRAPVYFTKRYNKVYQNMLYLIACYRLIEQKRNNSRTSSSAERSIGPNGMVSQSMAKRQRKSAGKSSQKPIEQYEHKENWSSRLISGDSLLVMNSLLEKEGMGGKVIEFSRVERREG